MASPTTSRQHQESPAKVLDAGKTKVVKRLRASTESNGTEDDDTTNFYPGILDLYQVAQREMSGTGDMSGFPDVPLPPSLQTAAEQTTALKIASDERTTSKKRKLRQKPVRTSPDDGGSSDDENEGAPSFSHLTEEKNDQEGKRASLAYSRGYSSGKEDPSKLFDLFLYLGREDLVNYVKLTPSLGTLNSATARQREATMEIFKDVRDQALSQVTGTVNGAFDKIIEKME